MTRILPVLAVILAALIPSTAARAAGQEVILPPSVDAQPGSIYIRASARSLYFVIEPGRAIRYPIAVPKRGMQWSGHARVDGKHLHPAWAPPAIVHRDHPELPSVIPGGAPNNPMGYAALTLDRREIAIHGTTQTMRRSIGTAASYGCIRMLNEDIADLFARVEVGADVWMAP